MKSKFTKIDIMFELCMILMNARLNRYGNYED